MLPAAAAAALLVLPAHTAPARAAPTAAPALGAKPAAAAARLAPAAVAASAAPTASPAVAPAPAAATKAAAAAAVPDMLLVQLLLRGVCWACWRSGAALLLLLLLLRGTTEARQLCLIATCSLRPAALGSWLARRGPRLLARRRRTSRLLALASMLRVTRLLLLLELGLRLRGLPRRQKALPAKAALLVRAAAAPAAAPPAPAAVVETAPPCTRTSAREQQCLVSPAAR